MRVEEMNWTMTLASRIIKLKLSLISIVAARFQSREVLQYEPGFTDDE